MENNRGEAERAWAGWTQASCMPKKCFCEGIRGGLIAQPANAWSSLGFVIVGLILGNRLRKRGRGMAETWQYLFVGSLFVVGFGSWFYHASLTMHGQFLDVMGMFLLGSLFFLFALNRWVKMSARIWLVSYLGLNFGLALAQRLPAARRYLFAVLIISGLVVEYVGKKKQGQEGQGAGHLGRAVILMALAFGIWILDFTKIWCAPLSVIQGHAIWHLLGAGAAYDLFKYLEANGRSLTAKGLRS